MTACRAMNVVLFRGGGGVGKVGGEGGARGRRPGGGGGSGKVGGEPAPRGVRPGDGGAEGGTAAGIGVGEHGGRDVAGGEQAADGPSCSVEHPAVVVGDEPAAGAEGAGPDGDRVVRRRGERGETGVRLPRVAEVSVLRALPAVEQGVAAVRGVSVELRNRRGEPAGVESTGRGELGEGSAARGPRRDLPDR